MTYRTQRRRKVNDQYYLINGKLNFTYKRRTNTWYPTATETTKHKTTTLTKKKTTLNKVTSLELESGVMVIVVGAKDPSLLRMTNLFISRYQ